MFALKNKVSFFVCFALLLGIGSTLRAAPYTPKVGSKERTSILNALRVPAEKKAKQKIVFYQVTMRVEKGWAYVTCISMDKTGKKYPLGELNTDGLMRKINGRWKVLHWGVAGDIIVACEAYTKYPKAPKTIFGGVLEACG